MAVASVTALLLGCALSPALAKGNAASDPHMHFRWSGVLAAGKTVEIHGINGPIDASFTTGDSVIVTATKSAHKSDPADVRVEATMQSDGVLVCARYPRASGALNDCAGEQNVQNNDVQVEFKVQLPAGVMLDARTINGSIHGNDLRSPVRANTINGDVRLSTTHYAEAATVNGGIHVKFGDATPHAPLEFTSVNGGIQLEVPKALGAELDARCTNGSVRCDLPVSNATSGGNHRLRGQIGAGGPRLKLETVNGSITIHGM